MLNIIEMNDPVLPSYSICTDFICCADLAVLSHVADVKVKNALAGGTSHVLCSLQLQCAYFSSGGRRGGFAYLNL
jgi:hypothetical protein